MVSVYRVRTVWTGLRGLPGVTTMYTSDQPAGISLADLKAFWDTVRTLVPTGCTMTIQPTGEIVDAATGQATGNWSATAPSASVGAVAGVYSAPTGAVINWLTGQFAAGRQIRGKTFIVPLAGACFQADGTLADSNRGTLETAAKALTASTFNITCWSRRSGASAQVVDATVPDMAVVLRSRRS